MHQPTSTVTCQATKAMDRWSSSGSSRRAMRSGARSRALPRPSGIGRAGSDRRAVPMHHALSRRLATFALTSLCVAGTVAGTELAVADRGRRAEPRCRLHRHPLPHGRRLGSRPVDQCRQPGASTRSPTSPPRRGPTTWRCRPPATRRSSLAWATRSRWRSASRGAMRRRATSARSPWRGRGAAPPSPRWRRRRPRRAASRPSRRATTAARPPPHRPPARCPDPATATEARLDIGATLLALEAASAPKHQPPAPAGGGTRRRPTGHRLVPDRHRRHRRDGPRRRPRARRHRPPPATGHHPDVRGVAARVATSGPAATDGRDGRRPGRPGVRRPPPRPHQSRIPRHAAGRTPATAGGCGHAPAPGMIRRWVLGP